MAKKYVGEFTSMDGKDYRLEIETKTGSGTTNIILGSNPFTTEMDSEGDSIIYSPINGTTATMEIVVENYYFDLYSEYPTNTKVSLIETSNNNNIVWVGYLTPQMFSQSFKLGLDTISLEAIDSLSVLDSLKYNAPDKQNLTFEQIIRKILSNVDIKDLYVSTNVQLNSSTSTETILDKLFISEMNFFDNKNEGESDDDVCWSCRDVMEEICRFLGYVAVCYEDDLYLLDYDAIKSGNAQYYKYTLSNTSSPTLVSLNHAHKLVGTDHYDNNSNVSLDNIYNKVSVKSDTFTYDENTGYSSSNNVQNITDTDVTSFSSSKGVIIDHIWGELFPADDDPSKAMDVWIDVHNDGGSYNTGGKHNYYDFTAMKFLKKPNCKHYIYNRSWQDISSQYQDKISYPIINKNNGGIAVKYFTKNIDKTKTSKNSEVSKQWSDYYKKVQTNPSLSSSDYLDRMLNDAGIHSISWNEAIIMTNTDGHLRAPESDWYKYPYYETECEGEFIQGGEHSAMIIQGQFYWHCIGSRSSSVDAYPMEFKDYKLDKPNWINPNVDMFVPASIQWGNLWWNGSDWQTTKCGFKLKWLGTEDRDDNNTKDKGTEIEAWKCQKTIMQPQPLTNTVNWRFGTTDEGCLITIPSNQNLSGKPKLTLYRPVTGRVWKSRKDWINGDNNGKLSGDYGTNNGIRWPWFFVALIGFKFKSIMGDQSYDGVNDTDTIYTNLLENNSIEELDEISFKVHTFDDKVNSYGAVATSGMSVWVDKLYNKALHNDERSWLISNGSLATNGMRQEEHLIYKLVRQYTTPSKVLEANIKIGTIKPFGIYQDTTLKDNYIVSKFGTDYRYGYNTIKFVEKK